MLEILYIALANGSLPSLFKLWPSFTEVDKTLNFHGITENSDKYGNVRGIVNKTWNFDIS